MLGRAPGAEPGVVGRVEDDRFSVSGTTSDLEHCLFEANYVVLRVDGEGKWSAVYPDCVIPITPRKGPVIVSESNEGWQNLPPIERVAR